MKIDDFSFSTVWNATRHQTAEEIIDEIQRMGFGGVELNFGLTRQKVAKIVKMANAGKIKVTSTHNFCPMPDEMPPTAPSPDFYSLASLDAEERKKAQNATKDSISYARDLGAAVLILHMGRVEMTDRTKELAANPQDNTQIRNDFVAERKTKNKPHLERAIESLEKLAGCAWRAGIKLGVENRYYYREIPLPEEFSVIFKYFPNDAIYYWHDVGHGQCLENVGLVEHTEYLKNFGDRLIGIHLHDIVGIKDHKPPGGGNFDFTKVVPYLKDDTLKVLEIHPPATQQEILKGVEYLCEKLQNTLSQPVNGRD